ncbi:MAG: hypothetical protein AB1725_03265 [Armatimonadota bacterium]
MPRLEVRTPSGLLEATDRIHDLWFDLDDMLGQDGSVRVLVLYADHRSGDASQILVVRSVLGVDVEDTERVGWYDVNELVWAEGTLTVTTGIPLRLSFRVSDLNMSVIHCR